MSNTYGDIRCEHPRKLNWGRRGREATEAQASGLQGKKKVKPEQSLFIHQDDVKKRTSPNAPKQVDVNEKSAGKSFSSKDRRAVPKPRKLIPACGKRERSVPSPRQGSA